MAVGMTVENIHFNLHFKLQCCSVFNLSPHPTPFDPHLTGITFVINHVRHSYTSWLVTIGHSLNELVHLAIYSSLTLAALTEREMSAMLCYRLVGRKPGCWAEVCQFDVPRAVDQDILRLDVSARKKKQKTDMRKKRLTFSNLHNWRKKDRWYNTSEINYCHHTGTISIIPDLMIDNSPFHNG